MKSTALMIVAATVVATGAPVFAKDQNRHSTVKSTPPGYESAVKSGPLGYASAPMSREEAIRTCNAEAAKWRYSDWQAAQLTNYRNCMTQNGQQFE